MSNKSCLFFEIETKNTFLCVWNRQINILTNHEIKDRITSNKHHYPWVWCRLWTGGNELNQDV